MKQSSRKGVKPQTIERAINYFKDVDYHLQINGNQISFKDNLVLSKKNNTSFYLLYYANKKGYYQRIQDGNYLKLKELTHDDVKRLIEYINSKRVKLKTKQVDDKLENKVKKKYKTSRFKTGISDSNKFFIVNQSGEVISRPLNVRWARTLAQKHAENNVGKTFYVCQVTLSVGMQYVATMKEI